MSCAKVSFLPRVLSRARRELAFPPRNSLLTQRSRPNSSPTRFFYDARSGRRSVLSSCSVTLLTAIKFVCKDLWKSVHAKTIDKLETDNRGMYILHDEKYQWLWPLLSSDSAECKDEIQAYVTFSCGFVRGAFAGLGWDCTVEAKTSKIPACAFHCTFDLDKKTPKKE